MSQITDEARPLVSGPRAIVSRTSRARNLIRLPQTPCGHDVSRRLRRPLLCGEHAQPEANRRAYKPIKTGY
jgi:hypothetical protein